ncbi:MAG: hypothetical protein Q9160_005374 [Pyrenula sp. 1 TL-2023]
MYFPQRRASKLHAIRSFVPDLYQFRRELHDLRKAFNDTGEAVHPSALQEVEQEREVAYEVQAVRQIQKPVKYKALTYPGLHQDLINFAYEGKLSPNSDAFENALVTLQKSGLRGKHTINPSVVANIRLYCSTQFSWTVQEAKTAPLAHLQRNVNWVLWSPISETALVLIPEEAEDLLPRLRGLTSPPACSLITYSAPNTRKMLRYFNDLKFYTIPSLPSDWQAPRWLTIGLGLFAGRLYFDYEEYVDIHNFLGIPRPSGLEEKETDIPEMPGDNDGERIPDHEDTNNSSFTRVSPSPTRSFTKEPLTFLRDWLAIRRRGQDFTNSPMGFICQGKPLTPDHPFFTSPSNTSARKEGALGQKTFDAQTVSEAVVIGNAVGMTNVHGLENVGYDLINAEDQTAFDNDIDDIDGDVDIGMNEEIEEDVEGLEVTDDEDEIGFDDDGISDKE